MCVINLQLFQPYLSLSRPKCLTFLQYAYESYCLINSDDLGPSISAALRHYATPVLTSTPAEQLCDSAPSGMHRVTVMGVSNQVTGWWLTLIYATVVPPIAAAAQHTTRRRPLPSLRHGNDRQADEHSPRQCQRSDRVTDQSTVVALDRLVLSPSLEGCIPTPSSNTSRLHNARGFERLQHWSTLCARLSSASVVIFRIHYRTDKRWCSWIQIGFMYSNDRRLDFG